MTDREIESRFIAAVIKDSSDERRQESRQIPPSVFQDERCRRAWSHLVKADSYEAACIGPAAVFFAEPTIGLEYAADRWHLLCRYLREGGPMRIAEVAHWTSNFSPNLQDRLKERRYGFGPTPEDPIPRFSVIGRPLCTAGNVSTLLAQAKTGKSAFVGAMIAARICAERGDSDRDTLGVSASLAPGILLHLDTEQSRYDQFALISRSLRRAGVDEAPGWLHSYSVAGFSSSQLRGSLRKLLSESKEGVFAVIIDGTADLVSDVNDAAECNDLVAELHALAIKHDAPILNVLHENPGSDTGKARGHLGSQLERKCESNLRLKKNGDVTTVFSERMRKAPILTKDGPRFCWDETAGMHMSCETASATREDIKRERLRDQAEAVFQATGSVALTWANLRTEIAKSEGIGASGASKRFEAMKALGVIRKDGMGMWRLAS